VYIKEDQPSIAMWWSNIDGRVSWCVGPKDAVGVKGMWAYVESMGFGPEEAGTRAWNVYSFDSGAWEEQTGVEVENLDRVVRQVMLSRPATAKTNRSISSVGTEQARQELEGISVLVDELVDCVVSGVAGAFPDSVPSTRPGTRDGTELDRDGNSSISLVQDEFRNHFATQYVTTLQSVRYGASHVRISGVVLHHGGSARPYTGINGEYRRSDEVCNGRAVYIKEDKPSIAMWWANAAGKISWCVGRKDLVGGDSMWAYVESVGFGPEEAGTRAWNVYSYDSGAWEEQVGVRVKNLDAPQREEIQKFRYGASHVRISGVVLHQGGSARPYKGINGEYRRSDEVCNGRAVYIKENIAKNIAMWWANAAGKFSWCVGRRDLVGGDGMWAYVESVGFGPEEAGTRAWNVYSYDSGAWEEQVGVRVENLVPPEVEEIQSRATSAATSDITRLPLSARTTPSTAGHGPLTPLDRYAERVLEMRIRSRPQSAVVPESASKTQEAAEEDADEDARESEREQQKWTELTEIQREQRGRQREQEQKIATESQDESQSFFDRLASHLSTIFGASLVRVSGVMLHRGGISQVHENINGVYQRSGRLCNGRAVYIHVSMPTALWWANIEGKISWCAGPKDRVGKDGIWAHVESMGFGPEEAGRRAWSVYSYNSGSWEQQMFVEVENLELVEQDRHAPPEPPSASWLFGVGLEVMPDSHGVYRVSGLHPFSPAEHCGLIEVGDVLHSINGRRVTAQGIEVLRNLIAGDQDSPVWLFFLLSTAPLDNLLLDLASFHQWRAVQLQRTRPFSAANSRRAASRAWSEWSANSPKTRQMDRDVSNEWPGASPSLSMSLAGAPAGLEVMVEGYHTVDFNGDVFIDEQEFEAYLAANRTVRYGAQIVRVSGVMLRYKGETKPYKGINGDYERSQEVSNGRAVYIKINTPSTALWWTNNDGKLCWCVGPKDKIGTDKMWGYVESMGFGPEEAERRPWVVYSYNSGSWEEQLGVEVLDLDLKEPGSSRTLVFDESSTHTRVEPTGSSAVESGNIFSKVLHVVTF
jgi:hypothetical protein